MVLERQVVAWAAGPDLVLRLKLMGGEAKSISKDARVRRQKNFFMDQHHHIEKWASFRGNQFKPGQDDIRSVKLLRPTQKPEDELEYVILGRASGAMNLITFSVSDTGGFSRTEFDTAARSIKDATTNEAPNPLLAACLSTRDLALYTVHSDDQIVKACDETSATTSTEQGQIWSCKFLRHNRLALGLGPSKTPIHVYDILPDGFSDQPIRKFEVRMEDYESPDAGCGITSVYPIVPITAASSAGGAEGDIFLSGGHDGIIRYVFQIWMLKFLGLPDISTAASTTFGPLPPLQQFSQTLSIAFLQFTLSLHSAVSDSLQVALAILS